MYIFDVNKCNIVLLYSVGFIKNVFRYTDLYIFKYILNGVLNHFYQTFSVIETEQFTDFVTNFVAVFSCMSVSAIICFSLIIKSDLKFAIPLFEDET